MLGYRQPQGKERALVPGGMLRKEQKAESLLEELVMRYSAENDVVCDLFAGSGSTAVAAAFRSRVTLLCEKDELCASLAAAHIVRRLEAKMPRQRPSDAIDVSALWAAEAVEATKSGVAGRGDSLSSAKVCGILVLPVGV